MTELTDSIIDFEEIKLNRLGEFKDTTTDAVIISMILKENYPYVNTMTYQQIIEANARYYTITYEGKLVGCIGMSLPTTQLRAVFIRSFCLLPEYRFNGLGEKILKNLKDITPKLNPLYLNIKEFNKPMQSLVKKLGGIETDDKGVWKI